jgi:hypothetical protein
VIEKKWRSYIFSGMACYCTSAFQADHVLRQCAATLVSTIFVVEPKNEALTFTAAKGSLMEASGQQTTKAEKGLAGRRRKCNF